MPDFPNIELHLDTDVLTLGDLEDLENARKMSEVRAWFEKFTGLSSADFRAIKVSQMATLRETVLASMQEAALPKANGARS